MWMMNANSNKLSTSLYKSETVSIGRFHAELNHSGFYEPEINQQPQIVFPRTSVVICHADKKSFVSNTNSVNFYNTDWYVSGWLLGRMVIYCPCPVFIWWKMGLWVEFIPFEQRNVTVHNQLPTFLQ